LTALLLLRAGYAYVPYSSLETVIEHSKEGYYVALRQTQGTIRTDVPNWQPWALFFLRALQQQMKRLAEKIERERIVLSAIPELSVQIVEYAREHGRVTIGDMVALTGTTRNTLKQHFRHLLERGTWSCTAAVVAPGMHWHRAAEPGRRLTPHPKFWLSQAQGSRTIPGVNNIETAVLEVCNIARREFRPSHVGNGRDLCIRVADRSAERTAVNGNLRKSSGCVALEPEDAARQILGKHSFGRCQQPLAAFALGEQLNPIKDFCLGDRRRKKFCCWLFRNPRRNPRRGFGPHEL
jgi:hypothetical protein